MSSFTKSHLCTCILVFTHAAAQIGTGKAKPVTFAATGAVRLTAALRQLFATFCNYGQLSPEHLP